LIAYRIVKLGKAWLAQAAATLILLSAWPVLAFAEPAMKEPAPPLRVETVASGGFDLGAMRGKVVLVDFWATWCAPCLAEFPIIAKFYQKHRAEGFEVIALSVDRPGNKAKMQRLSASLPFNTALLSEASRNGFGTPEAVPVSYLIDANGIVRDKFIAIDDELLNEVAVPLLKEAQPAAMGAGR
jgi:cytochrome c biogenesis protein CcmG, thiol:disulfide interchange protein DsbE